MMVIGWMQLLAGILAGQEGKNRPYIWIMILALGTYNIREVMWIMVKDGHSSTRVHFDHLH